MESHVYWLFVICYVSWILRENSLGESIPAEKVFASINNASQKTENITVQSIEVKTRFSGVTLKDDLFKFDVLLSPKNFSDKIKTSNNFSIARCLRYCIQEVEKTGNNNPIEDINLFLLSLAGNEDKNLNIQIYIEKKENCNEILDEDKENKAPNDISNIYAISLMISKKNGKQKLTRMFKRSSEIKRTDIKKQNNERNEETMADYFSDMVEHVTKNTNYTILSLRNNPLTSYGDIEIPQNASKNTQEQQKIQPRSSEIASLTEERDTNEKDIKQSIINNDVFMQIQNEDFSTQFVQNIGDSFERRKILLEINAKSNLFATPGTTHRVLFDVTNNCLLPVRYAIRARSSPFRILNVQPVFLWLNPGETNYVAVDIIVPLSTQDTVNTLTLLIDGTEIPEKTVYIYVKNAISKSIDNIKPTLEYSFNSNCAGKLDPNNCEKTFWSVDIKAQDADTGLKRVISTPNGLYFRTKFVSGTKDSVTFYYSSSCCSTTATITAIDISDNQYSRTIYVTEWDNLSQGEIAAIVLGALLLLFFIILVIIAIIYCVRKRNGHDLPYTQKYGSRPTARSERTSF